MRRCIIIAAAFSMALAPHGALAAHKKKTVSAPKAPAAAAKPAPAPAAQAVKPAVMAANIDNVRGAVTGVHKGGGAAAALGVNFPVFTGDTIETGPDGGVALTLDDGTQLAMGPKGKLVIDEVFNPGDSAMRRTRIGIYGAVFEYADNNEGTTPGDDVRLDVDSGALVLHGADIMGGFREKAGWAYLVTGKADAASGGGTISLAPGQGARFAGKKAAPELLKKWTDGDVRWIRDVLRPPATASALATEPASGQNPAKNGKK